MHEHALVASQEVTSLAPYVADYLTPVMNLDTAKARLLEFQQFIKFYLREGEDFGTIPGTPKPTLLKPGADKLCEIYGLADTYPDSRVHRTEDWSKEPPLFDYEVTCVLIHKSTGVVVGEGMGSCNSYESKYKWRDQNRKCPNCNHESIFKAKKDGEGWYCWAKKGGCGAKFPDDDPRITSQVTGRIINPDIADQKNTLLKMAKKRAKIDATIAATRSSGIFTQDMEDIAPPEVFIEVAQTKEYIEKHEKAFEAREAAQPPVDLTIDEKAAIPAFKQRGIQDACQRTGKSEVILLEHLGRSGFNSLAEVTNEKFPEILSWANHREDPPKGDLTEILERSKPAIAAVTAGLCHKCGGKMKPAGTNRKTGKPYKAFCPDDDCESNAWKKKPKAQTVEADHELPY